ncbi:MAG: hypothetical protein A2096_03605 [Spirochaetes bacterium GWF1_41_5]|nr:MAG: hypothetical protein A2096_03605 [Spirochaetes bacterium GWF1_41_5]HBE03387.1 flagellar hook assembly protein FlgD [Spirochaetia bacterium]
MIEPGLLDEIGDFNLKNGFKRHPANEAMGKDQFLKLLVTQLSHQNPLEPMDNKEFIAQMAQFSSLEQMSQLNKSMDSLLTGFEAMKSDSYLGKNVEYQDESGTMARGKAESVHFEEKSVKVMVNGNSIPAEKIKSVYAENSAQIR